MAPPLKIAWKHPAEVFHELYKQKVDAWIAKRWQALGMLRRGKRLKQVQEIGGVAVGEVVWGWEYRGGRETHTREWGQRYGRRSKSRGGKRYRRRGFGQ
jgi:hypothetical protein